ncbi:MAG: DNA (cytosine-5-)-methyltransferase [Spirochaetota bacterium]|nr:DNA (cytosine-5-)-methyltransferase [Spirochaetota bacterium]
MITEKEVYTLNQFADLLSVSKETLRRWDNSGKLKAKRNKINGYRYYTDDHVFACQQLEMFIPSNKEAVNFVKPNNIYKSIELFAGAGGLALGFEKAGIEHSLLNEIDKWACETLRVNRPEWNISQDDIKNLDFTKFRNEIDVLTGGFPCQAFSYAGKKLGLNDTRGTLFFEYARAIKEINPKICIAENVRGLFNHDLGRTLNGMINVLNELGYQVLPPKILKAIHYNVPQKRERLILVAIRKDITTEYNYPLPNRTIYALKDALKKGTLFSSDVPDSPGQTYPKRKKEILKMVPPGGYWRDLPLEIQKEYMLKSFYLGGGKTGMARRISWDEPSLTLTCAPAQKQTERCHPDETRPFKVREYARIQTFPDDWIFSGSISQQYKQIGNAVPVNLAKEIAYSVIDFLNRYYSKETSNNSAQKHVVKYNQVVGY